MKRSVMLFGFLVLAGTVPIAMHFAPSAAAQSVEGPLRALVPPVAEAARKPVETLEKAMLRERAESERQAALDRVIKKMPDLTQTDPELNVAGGGDAWCGPTAMSNALMWLAEQGRESLAPPGSDSRERQLALVRTLGSSRYMATTPTGGTGPKSLLTGLHAYLRDTGWSYQRLQYQGWRSHPVRFTTHEKAPKIDFIAKALHDGGVAIVHAGWYTPAKYGGNFHRRHGGHWLTVVGANVDENGKPSENTLVLHDPAPYSGSRPARHFVTVRKLEDGWLIAEDGPFPAKGHSVLEGGMRIKVPGDIAVLDGAVALVP
jgi:hypothetical protein